MIKILAITSRRVLNRAFLLSFTEWAPFSPYLLFFACVVSGPCSSVPLIPLWRFSTLPDLPPLIAVHIHPCLFAKVLSSFGSGFCRYRSVLLLFFCRPRNRNSQRGPAYVFRFCRPTQGPPSFLIPFRRFLRTFFPYNATIEIPPRPMP